MIPDLRGFDRGRWNLLTANNIVLKKVWPWAPSIQRTLASKERGPAPVRHLVVASDYGGEHKSASHLVYVYLVVAGGADVWAGAMRALRQRTLGARTMAYKSLGDAVRQAALPDFLAAAAALDGHLVAIAVDKRQKWLSTSPGEAGRFHQAFHLQCFWNPRALEALVRKAHFLALLLSVWAPAGADITWLTDHDEFVANDKRHDDALATAGRLSAIYLNRTMGIFALNTTAQDAPGRYYEDLCSVADLAAGMLSDVRRGLGADASWDVGPLRLQEPALSLKAQLLLDWFADGDMRLRKTLISIDHLGAQSVVREIWIEPDPSSSPAHEVGQASLPMEPT
jgi:hypothetical protein